jgi:23S rRNA pseudouridine1911/1915/1917 synthase
MVFAKTSKAASRLSDQIRKGLWKKTYIAIVDGVPEKKEGTLKDYLLKDKTTNTVSVVKKGVEGSKEALLSYKILRTEGSRSMLEIDLKTGRSHQIRVQLLSRGMPIVNDHRYNPDHERGKDIALWSNSLEIVHPVTGEKLSFASKCPECFDKLMKS